MSNRAKSDAKPCDTNNRGYQRIRAAQERTLAEHAGTEAARAIHAELAALHEAAGDV